MFIVRQGKPQTQVVLPDDAGEDMKQAASDLIRIVRKSTGAKLPRVTAGSNSDDGAGIRLRIDERLARRSSEGFPVEGTFRLACRGRTLEIAGGTDRATAYGVYEFLEQAVNVRWFFPGSLGEDVPERSNVSFRPGRKTYRGSFPWRSVGYGNEKGWFIPHKQRRFPVTGAHAYQALLPQKLFAGQPELFSKVFGKRRKHPSQICHSASGMVERGLNYVDEQLRKNPDAKAVSFGPNDFGFFCECEKCRAWDDVTRYYDYYVHEPPYGYGGPGFESHLSERVFDYTNRVADAVAEKHPDLFLIVLAYGAYRFPPEGMTIRDNVIVWLTSTCVGMWNEERRAAEEHMVRAWRNAARHVVIFEAMANQCWPCVPREVSPLAAEALRMYHRHGVEGYFTQMFGDFATNLPSYYVAARLSWDVKRDPETELKELWKRGFGPAAKPIERYFNLLRNTWQRKTEDGALPWARSVICTKRQYGLMTYVFPKGVMAEARQAIEEARKAAGRGGVYRRRVDFIEVGLRWTELVMAAVRECEAFEDFGFPLLYPTPWGQEPYDYDYAKLICVGNHDRRTAAHAARRAIAALDAAEEFARKYDGQFVLAPNIVQRFRKNTRFDQTREILKKIAGIMESNRPDPKQMKQIFK